MSHRKDDNCSSCSCNCFFSSKVHPAFHNIANGLLKSCMLGRRVIYVRYIKIVHTTMWPKVSIFVIKMHFFVIEKNFMLVKAFERYSPLTAITYFISF